MMVALGAYPGTPTLPSFAEFLIDDLAIGWVIWRQYRRFPSVYCPSQQMASCD